MDDIVKRIDTPEKCEIFATNCLERGRKDLALEARQRAIQLRAEAHDAETDAEREALEAIYAYEEVLSTKNGKKTRAQRTWQMIERHGIIGAVERAVNRPMETQGYKSLVEMGLENYAFEAVILRYSSFFSQEAVQISKARISQRERVTYPFRAGNQYTRKDVFRILGMADPGGGSWYTGYTSHGEDHFIFCGVGATGRTGHDYQNRFVGDELVWFGKSQSRLQQPSIQNLLNSAGHVYIFFREDNREAFTFAGLAYPIKYLDSSPVEVTWAFDGTEYNRPEIPPEEIPDPESVSEGAKKTVTVNVYERDPNARRQCLKHWGIKCVICSFDFELVYGELGRGFIHVHHLRPLGEVGEEYELNPVQDLRPVCPNCHAMLHRKKPALSIDELKEKLASNAPEFKR